MSAAPIHKAFAYITHGQRLLVFRHVLAPEAGVQVPAGTLRDGEDPAEGALREALEETGLGDLHLAGYLGTVDHVPEGLGQVYRRHFFHLACGGEPPERWRHAEEDPSEGEPGPIPFEFFWAVLPDGVPPLAPGHDTLLGILLARLGLRAADEGGQP